MSSFYVNNKFLCEYLYDYMRITHEESDCIAKTKGFVSIWRFFCIKKAISKNKDLVTGKIEILT